MQIRSLALFGVLALVPLSACPGNEESPADAGGGGADVVSPADAHQNNDATANADAAEDAGVNADAAGGEDATAPDALTMNPPELASGTRLRAIVVATPEGTKELRGRFDRDRNEACAFANAEDGIERCLPGPY